MTSTAETAHRDAINALTAAATTAELAVAIATFTHLDKPGFPNDLADGRYYDGTFFATMTGGQLQVTQVHQLPRHTMALWAELDEEQRAARDREQFLAEEADERRGPGQPPIGRPVPVRLPAWLITKLDRTAEAEGTSRARLIRDLITEALAARNGRPA